MTSPSPIALELAGAAAQIVLGDHVQRRAELPRERGRVTTADAQAAVIDARGRGFRWVAVTGTARR